uniref:Transmembrane protein n=1 Tax=Grammatophora oceanica TaxID=210454 RepID=A0A7S1VMS0_9STRA|mmetsp:Transcript_49291/g.73521  ORF Transcript_49291/g.73521 Transcript_49291/m.73521 type:complete len:424 (+) Transcript_49291:88-1359(+)
MMNSGRLSSRHLELRLGVSSPHALSTPSTPSPVSGAFFTPAEVKEEKLNPATTPKNDNNVDYGSSSELESLTPMDADDQLSMGDDVEEDAFDVEQQQLKEEATEVVQKTLSVRIRHYPSHRIDNWNPRHHDQGHTPSNNPNPVSAGLGAVNVFSSEDGIVAEDQVATGVPSTPDDDAPMTMVGTNTPDKPAAVADHPSKLSVEEVGHDSFPKAQEEMDGIFVVGGEEKDSGLFVVPGDEENDKAAPPLPVATDREDLSSRALARKHRQRNTSNAAAGKRLQFVGKDEDRDVEAGGAMTTPAVPEEPPQQEPSSSQSVNTSNRGTDGPKRNNVVCCGLIGLGCLVVINAVVVAVVVFGLGGASTSHHYQPSVAPTTSPPTTSPPMPTDFHLTLDASTVYSSEDALSDPPSPQYQAALPFVSQRG